MATPATTTTTPAPQPGLDINAIKAQLLSGGAAAGTTSYIGFPAGVSTLQGVGGADTSFRQPLYGEGSEWLPVRQNATPSDIAKLQDQLVAAGLLNSDYRAGVWDQPSMQAFTQVLGLANASGNTWQDALTSYSNGAPMVRDPKTGSYVKGTTGTSRTNAPLVTRFTSPDDLAATAQEVATSKLGRSFTPDELQRFVTAYHGTEAASSQAQGAAGAAAGGGYTAAPSPDVAAETFAKQVDPTAYNAEAFLPLVQKMNEMLANPNPYNTTKPMPA